MNVDLNGGKVVYGGEVVGKCDIVVGKVLDKVVDKCDVSVQNFLVSVSTEVFLQCRKVCFFLSFYGLFGKIVSISSTLEVS